MNFPNSKAAHSQLVFSSITFMIQSRGVPAANMIFARTTWCDNYRFTSL